MGCFFLLIALISPRLALFFVWILTDWLSRAYEGWLVPVLGWFLLPWTTLAYAAFYASSNDVSGIEWFFIILAFLFDLAQYAGGIGRYATDAD